MIRTTYCSTAANRHRKNEKRVSCLQHVVEEDGSAGVKAEIFHGGQSRGATQHEREEVRHRRVCVCRTFFIFRWTVEREQIIRAPVKTRTSYVLYLH